MNQIKDIFNTQFFVILGVVLLLITCLVLYTEQKFKAYDHKMTSMLSLVSSLAEEMEMVKGSGSGSSSGLNNMTMNVSANANANMNQMQTNINELSSSIEENKLIDVSDDSDNSDGSDSDSDSDSDYESDNLNSDSESDADEETDLNSIIEPVVEELDNLKSVNALDLAINEPEIITIKKLEEPESFNHIVDLDESNDLEEIENLDNDNDLDGDLDDDLDGDLDDDLDGELNDIVDLDEEKDDTIDYNKLSVPKLKEIALEKNLISTTSNKMKKAELLKLLEEN